MPTTIYRNKEGKILSGVTTIIHQNLGWGARALMHWAWKLGMDGIDYRKEAEESADAGTIAHEMIECEIKGKEFDASKYDPALVDKAENAFLSFLEWKDHVGFEAIETEIHLVSEKYQYGATPDCIARINGKLALFDWKTSNELYPEHIVQLAAYRVAWEENFPDKPLVGGYYLLRITKGEDISFHWHHWEDLSIAWEVFLCCLKLHQLRKEFKKL